MSKLPESSPPTIGTLLTGGGPVLPRSITDRREDKPTNPKDIVGISKVPFSTISAPVMAEVGVAMLEGALKYGRHNYRAMGVRASVYYDATMRHLTDWWEGTDIDPASGMNHITKAIASLTVLRDSMIRGNMEDDRPPAVQEGWLDALNVKAASLVTKYKDVRAHHYTQLNIHEGVPQEKDPALKLHPYDLR